MGNAISIGPKPTQADMTAAKFNRDFYVVFLKDSTGPLIPQTSWTSATLDQLVDGILEAQMEMPGSIESIAHFNPIGQISRLVEHEVADAVAERSHVFRKTPHEPVVEWLESFRCDYFADDEYLTNRAANDLLTHADDHVDYRRTATGW